MGERLAQFIVRTQVSEKKNLVNIVIKSSISIPESSNGTLIRTCEVTIFGEKLLKFKNFKNSAPEPKMYMFIKYIKNFSHEK